MWTTVFLRGLAVYLEPEHKQPIRTSTKDRPKDGGGVSLRSDGTANQILQVVTAASREGIHSSLELPSDLREQKERRTRLNVVVSC